jgi:hypothetical protein
VALLLRSIPTVGGDNQDGQVSIGRLRARVRFVTGVTYQRLPLLLADIVFPLPDSHSIVGMPWVLLVPH